MTVNLYGGFMTRVRETFQTLWLATRYSLAFCWRNDKPWTIARFSVTALTTLMLYGVVQATGLVANAVQYALAHPGEASQEKLWGPISLFSTLLLIGVVLGRLNWYTQNRWNQRLNAANQREVQSHRATLDVAQSRSKTYDDLDKRINELPDGRRTRVAFTEHVISIFATLVSFVLFGTTLLWHTPEYALILALTTLPMFLVEFKEGAWWWNTYEGMVPHFKKRAVLETTYRNKTAFLQGLMFNQMPVLRKQIDKKFDEEFNTYEEVRRKAVRYEIFAHFLATVGLIGVIIHAIWSTVLTGGEIGTLTIVMAAAKTFRDNLEQIAAHASQQWNRAKGVILIEKDFFGLKPIIQTPDPIVPNFQGSPCIRFDRVSFAYPEKPDKEILKEVSFTIESGSKIALVGKNGHGKSTIQALLTRHYDPTSGAIYADNINLRNIEQNVWCNYVSALTQDYIIIDRTIEEEIASSRLDQSIDHNALELATKFTGFDEVVESDPLGYKSQIGTEFGGRDFSGGEKQRLALARVHYRATPILILDEPEAKQDPESAQRIIDRIFALENVTVILITHAISRIERCDKVIVLNQGEVVEEGAPADLLARGGHYTSLFRADKFRSSSTSVQIGQ